MKHYSKLIAAVVTAAVGIAVAAGVDPDVTAAWEQAAIAVLVALGVWAAPANES